MKKPKRKLSAAEKAEKRRRREEYMTEGEFSEEPMSLWDKCPICGGDLEEKVVEKLLRGGNHTTVLQIQGEVCFHCRERLYPEETVKEIGRPAVSGP